MGKRIYLLLFVLCCNLVVSQEFYKEGKKLLNKDELQLLYAKVKEKATDSSLKDLQAAFRTNRIEVRGDSIINFGHVTFVSKKEKPEKIFNLINKPLPNFNLERYKGQYLSNEDLKGKLTIINLWFTNCSACIKEMPALNAIKERYGDKLNFIGITFDDRGKVFDLFKTHFFNFEILIEAKSYLNKLGIETYPKILIVDKNNIIRYVDFGIPITDNKKLQEQEEGEFYKTIDDLLLYK